MNKGQARDDAAMDARKAYMREYWRVNHERIVKQRKESARRKAMTIIAHVEILPEGMIALTTHDGQKYVISSDKEPPL